MYTTRLELENAINSFVYSTITNPNHVGTNTPHALNLLRTTGRSGCELRLRDDPTTSKTAVIITDGRTHFKCI